MLTITLISIITTSLFCVTKLVIKKYNYTVDTITEILRSDAMRGKSDQEIFDFIKNSLSKMDIYIGGI